MAKAVKIFSSIAVVAVLIWGIMYFLDSKNIESEQSIEDVLIQGSMPAHVESVLPPEDFDRGRDCPTECSRFSEQPEEFLHCQQACGLVASTNQENCDTTQGFEKDICVKDRAVAELNSDLCAEIADADLQETCRNRIIEEIIDTQQGLRQ